MQDEIAIIDSGLKLNGYKFIGCGRQRAVFRRKNFVIKIPMCEDGLHSNSREAFTYKKSLKKPCPNGTRYARCKLLANGWLVMQYVKDYYRCNPRPEHNGWIDYIDCQQVGLNIGGRLVAYDYGL